jgi:hypothetical protein
MRLRTKFSLSGFEVPELGYKTTVFFHFGDIFCVLDKFGLNKAPLPTIGLQLRGCRI